MRLTCECDEIRLVDALTTFVHTLDSLARANRKLDLLLAHVAALTAKVNRMDDRTQQSLDNLNAAVEQETTIEKSVETLLTGLAAQIADLKKGVTDPAVLAVIDQATGIVKANNDALAAAVAANTPAATA